MEGELIMLGLHWELLVGYMGVLLMAMPLFAARSGVKSFARLVLLHPWPAVVAFSIWCLSAGSFGLLLVWLLENSLYPFWWLVAHFQLVLIHGILSSRGKPVSLAPVYVGNIVSFLAWAYLGLSLLNPGAKDAFPSIFLVVFVFPLQLVTGVALLACFFIKTA